MTSDDQGTAWVTARFDAEFRPVPAMVILRGLGPGRSLELAEAAWEAGIRAVEIPVQQEQDLDTLREVARCAGTRGRSVGAGTVVDPDQVAAVRDAGAAYVVSPGLDPALVATCLSQGLPPLPGVATGSEVQRAVTMGLTWLKVFPAAVLGPGWFTAMRGPFPQVKFVATGGISAATAQDFLDAGASAVALGAALTDPIQLGRLSGQRWS
ncbi:bifunctional 4-hydroxy-2-oxoglutarate aldolase/2-dehydro-3-deoxy-phosphogluconate aldolase [Arachnia propionica]|nr:bifunctional 4-hydroxy-2-oxoglutarate aldolase/2-dehydro-3-deoxy-phosphogluconate aldolase [Arachnia propionica]